MTAPAATAHRPPPAGPADDSDALRAAVLDTDAPDVVFARSTAGRRTFAAGGTAPYSGIPREELRYEIGSATKTFTGLLLAELAHHRHVRLHDPAAVHLNISAAPHRHRDRITLLHLITHTAGLPRLPWDFYPQALPNLRTNAYAGYSHRRLVDAYARSRPLRPPGSHWHYSNFGVALLGPALEGATGTPYEQLLSRHVLGPLGLGSASLLPQPTDATGHARDGWSELPPFDAGGFTASGALRATPGDLMTYLEAHLRPQGSPLEDALHAVREPLLVRGLHRHTHTLTWIRHPSKHGPVYFHSGATMGQEAFLGFRPATNTALVAVANRRYHRRTTLGYTAYRLLTEEP